MADAAVYGFLPWVRSGLASMTKPATTQNFGSLSVTLTVNTTPTNPVTVRLYGPGQVTGIDPRAITRMEPRPGAVSFEPNYFPAIEFATPDFPWMFSPADRPWLCLVAVKVQPGVAITPRGHALPLLQFSSPAAPVDELPNLDEIAMWAHAQIAGAAPANDDAIRAALADPSSGRVSRLVCPRHLEPDTQYLACLVPTYHAGVQAGISPDLPADDTDVAPAWSSTTTAPFALPVYAYWTFSTGDAGDFASLARKLHPPTAPLDVGLLPMDESASGFGMPTFPGLALSLEGALQAPQTSSTLWPPGVQAQFEHALTPLLTPPPAPVPIVTPPVYGQWPAGATHPVWLHDLNFDPRMRAAAGMGVRAVRADQENLIASAWDQFQQLRQANQRLRQFQLARVISQVTLDRHINAVGSAGAFLQLTRPLHARVKLTLGTATATLNAHLSASRIAPGAVAGAFRRLVRRGGPLGRRLFASAPSRVVERLDLATGAPSAIAVVGQLIAPAGTALLDQVASGTPGTSLNVGMVTAAPGWGTVLPAPAPGGGPPPQPKPPGDWKDDPQSPVWLRTGAKTFPAVPGFPPNITDYEQMELRFRGAALKVVTYIAQHTRIRSDTPQPPVFAAPLTTAQSMVVTALDPRTTLLARASAQLVLDPTGDPLRPRIGAPQFTRPMSLALSPRQLLPGVENVPDESVSLLLTNPRFVEAYMNGLNDEMRRELAWRQYPVDSTATFFANFWSTTADIPPIATWPSGNALGTNADTHNAQVVLLVRGELLRRYPNAVISAVPAVMGPDHQRHLGTPELFPVFRGSIDPDMTFFGFALTKAQATAGLGYYFVLAEHPSEPRFGLEPAASGGTIASWNDLGWPQVTVVHNHLSVATPPTATAPGATWGASSAQQAYITYRQPVRLALLATALLG